MKKQPPQSILIVDDDANLRVALSDFLKFEGFAVSTACSGEDALVKLEELTPALILLDMSMPGMGGLEFLRQISAKDGHSPYPVLVLTARANMQDLFDDLRVDGFMLKPCEPQSLVAEISSILSDAARKTRKGVGKRTTGTVQLCLDTHTAVTRVSALLASAGIKVFLSEPGMALVGDSVRKKPDCIVVGPHAHGMSLAALATVLAQLPQTKGIPIVVAGFGLEHVQDGQAWPENRRHDQKLDDIDPESIVRSVRSVLEIPNDSK